MSLMQEYNLGFNLLCYEAVFFGICVQNSCAVLQRADSLLLFSAMLYECVTQECPEMMPTYIAIEQVIQTVHYPLTDYLTATWKSARKV